jgi:hypothetical protein
LYAETYSHMAVDRNKAHTGQHNARKGLSRERADLLKRRGYDPAIGQLRRPDAERALVTFEDNFELCITLYRNSDPSHIASVCNARRRHGPIVGLRILCGVTEGEK